MSEPAADSALDRLRRVLYVASGIGGLVFGALLLTGDSGILAQREVLAPWYWWLSLVVALLLPISLIAIAPVASASTSRAVASGAVVGFLLVEALWIPAMSVDVLPTGTTPWLQGITALSSTLAGITWRSRWVWAVPVAQGPIVTTVQLLCSDRTTVEAVLDGVGALLFCSVLTGIAQAVLKAGDTQDAAAAAARLAAMQAAASETQERERARINAIVHDDIMSVLLTASRVDPGPEVSARAAEAIDAVAGLAHPADEPAAAVSAAYAEAVVRSTVSHTAPEAALAVARGDGDEIPGIVVAAVAEAVSEALRNTSRHAGPDATVSVTARLRADHVSVQVSDDGRGFDPRAVGATRLGIATSIRGRMATVPGGSATIDSHPGDGTRVLVEWSRP